MKLPAKMRSARAVNSRTVLRRLFTFCAAVSLLLCAAVGGVWVRSYWASDYIGREDRAGWVGVLSMSGVLRVERGGYATREPGWDFEAGTPSSLRAELEARDRTGPPWLHRLGFAYAHIVYDPTRHRRAVYLPHWAAGAVFAVLPATWVAAAVRRRRAAGRVRAGLCRVCGYDLRATPGRCPECGTTAPRPRTLE
jgi:hypothetical protein